MNAGVLRGDLGEPLGYFMPGSEVKEGLLVSMEKEAKEFFHARKATLRMKLSRLRAFQWGFGGL